MQKEYHPFKPIINSKSKILILGSFPSVTSREQGFYYSHPRNRFWQVLGKIFNYTTLKDKSPNEKENFLLQHRIALYDICIECQIINSSDSNLNPITIAPLESLIQSTQIQHIFTNGKKRHKSTTRILKILKYRPCITLPCPPQVQQMQNGILRIFVKLGIQF